ncbi:MAG: hemin uptake protein HemP [Ottowia sp.]|uniref:hemin uptake protein HemP n=1 Tax=Ottowia sp. TaxID=1898956 RepID=UPI0039E41A29
MTTALAIAPTAEPLRRKLSLPARATSPRAPVPRAADSVAPAPLPSDHLLRGRKTIEISHNGSVYRLQATKLGKLILTK